MLIYMETKKNSQYYMEQKESQECEETLIFDAFKTILRVDFMSIIRSTKMNVFVCVTVVYCSLLSIQKNYITYFFSVWEMKQ